MRHRPPHPRDPLADPPPHPPRPATKGTCVIRVYPWWPGGEDGVGGRQKVTGQKTGFWATSLGKMPRKHKFYALKEGAALKGPCKRARTQRDFPPKSSQAKDSIMNKFTTFLAAGALVLGQLAPVAAQSTPPAPPADQAAAASSSSGTGGGAALAGTGLSAGAAAGLLLGVALVAAAGGGGNPAVPTTTTSTTTTTTTTATTTTTTTN